MARMSGAEALVSLLAREGTKVIFGLPGVQIIDALDAIYRDKSIRWLSVRHEQTAAYMAYGYALTSGKTGVAMVLPGPGALNTAAAIGTAYSSSAPVLLITGQIESEHIGYKRGVLHEFDEQQEIFRYLSRYCSRATRPEDIPNILYHALCELKTGSPLPVEIEVPFNLWTKQGEMVFPNTENSAPLPPDDASIEKSVEILKKARRPMILVGRGTVTSGISTEVKTLAEKLKAPVVMTSEALGLIPDIHPFCGGNAALFLNPIFKKSDAVLIIGTKLRAGGNSHFHSEPDQQVVQVDCNSGELQKNSIKGLEIVADIKLFMKAVLKSLSSQTSSLWQEKEIISLSNELKNQLEQAAPLQMSIMNTIHSVLGDSGILVPDVTNIGYWCDIAYPVNKLYSFIGISYFATLGYAFPTALGCKVANPDKAVVAICGDGGFPYASAELATAVQEKINLVALIFTDNAYGTISDIQRHRCGGRYFGNKIHNPDYVKFAEAFGALGMRVEKHEELGKKLSEALQANKPALIEIPVPQLETPWDALKKG